VTLADEFFTINGNSRRAYAVFSLYVPVASWLGEKKDELWGGVKIGGNDEARWRRLRGGFIAPRWCEKSCAEAEYECVPFQASSPRLIVAGKMSMSCSFSALRTTI
jgi:hypothetical protein